MRPLEVRLRNFRSFFGDGHTFDFRERHLIGIVGPIGSGKSTLLDAVAFALYGRTPRIARSTKSLIHQRADHAAVALRFEVDGEIWEAVRQLRRNGASQHALYRYAEDEPDPETAVEKIVLEGDVNARIEELLGFDFDAFGRSVLLAQGQFAEFLNSQPVQRDKVLKGVFGHERIDAMRELAKARVKESDHEIEKLAIRLEQTEHAAGRVAGHRQSLATAEERLAALEAAQPEMEQLDQALAEAEERIEASTLRLGELTRLAEKLPDAARSEEAIDLAERARSRRKDLATQLETAHEAAALAEAAVKSEEYEARVANLAHTTELIVRLDAHREKAASATSRAADAAKRLATVRTGHEAAVAAVAAAEGEAKAADEAALLARERLDEAEQRLMAARHADMAASLRVGLEVGSDCPVCEQPVHALPPAGSTESVSAIEGEVAAARADKDDLERRARETAAALEAARASLQAAVASVDDAEKDAEAAAVEATAREDEVTGALAAIEERVGAGDPAAQVAAEKAEITAIESEAESARKRVEEIRRSLDEAIDAEQEADRALGDLRTQLGALAAQLDAGTAIPEDDPAALRQALGGLRDGWAATTEALQSGITKDRAEVVAVGGRRTELMAELSVEGTLSDAMAALKAEAGLLQSEIERDEALIASAADLIEERQAAETTAEHYRRLAADLTDAKFIRFLLEEEKAALSELGSDHFQRLSSGRYRFTDDGTFQVMDLTAAEGVRKADSLSGGETFLASLGLALGLSEMVGRTGGRLDAFFLDEGFGTLDADHLDLAMEGIEALVTDHASRLVVVVSHVAELRQRIEDLIVLDKDPVTGDSVVVSGAVLSGR